MQVHLKEANKNLTTIRDLFAMVEAAA